MCRRLDNSRFAISISDSLRFSRNVKTKCVLQARQNSRGIIPSMSSSRIRPKQPWRFFVIGCSVFACGLTAHSQTEVSQEAQEKAALFGARAFAHCGDVYYTNSYELPKSACLNLYGPARQINSCQVIQEMSAIEGQPFTYSPAAPPTRAQLADDRDRGIQLHGYVKFNYFVSRTRFRTNGEWLSWGKRQDQRPPATVAELWKIHGQWFASDLRNAGQMMSNLTPPGNDSFLPGGTMPAVGELLTRQFGPSTTLDQLLKTIELPSCEDIGNPEPHMALAPPAPKLPVFDGTIDEFTAAFPGFLQQAAIAKGQDPRSYEQEASYIVGLVRTCSQITPQMAKSVTSEYGITYLSKLGAEKYGKCGPLVSAPPDKNEPTGLVKLALLISMNPSTRWSEPHSFENPDVFHARIVFSERTKLTSFLIVDATIR